MLPTCITSNLLFLLSKRPLVLILNIVPGMKRLYFPASLAARCGHVTKLLLMRHKQKGSKKTSRNEHRELIQQRMASFLACTPSASASTQLRHEHWSFRSQAKRKHRQNPTPLLFPNSSIKSKTSVQIKIQHAYKLMFYIQHPEFLILSSLSPGPSNLQSSINVLC